MPELGETVSPPDFASEVHTEATCPWHTKEKSSAGEMKAVDPDEDVKGAIPPNDGGTLGRNMQAAGVFIPAADEVWIGYGPMDDVHYKSGNKKKSVQTYVEVDGFEIRYELQYAPHHLIPGNGSLKGSAVVPYLGDEATIKHFKKGEASKIMDGHSVGYDVNAASNGVWLPSPYALSNCNDWPAIPGITALKKQRGEAVAYDTTGFKEAYVAAAIEASGNRQFHMSHKKYSDKVREILKSIGARLKSMAGGECPIASGSKSNGKLVPPAGLPGRLDVLSGNLERLVTGAVWRPPLFTDSMTKEYAERLRKTKLPGDIQKVL